MEGSYGSEISGEGEEEQMETESLSDEASLMRDKEWFTQIFIAETLKGAITYQESELEALRNKKKGGSKKNKDKLNSIQAHLNAIK
jgi:hypothetical protein